MISLFSPNYLSRTPIDRAMQAFGRRFGKRETVIDIGCGDKPYATYFSCKYIGVDPFPGTKSDLKTDAWKVPLPDGTADGIVLNQSMEHIPKTVETVREIYRLLKPNGFVLVSVPQMMHAHGTLLPIEEAPIKNIPAGIARYWREDYYRFTKYALLLLFKDFIPVKLYGTTTIFSTPIQQLNYFIATWGLGWLPAPIYFLNNILALSLDAIWNQSSTLPLPSLKRFDELVVRGLTIDHIFIAQRKKHA